MLCDYKVWLKLALWLWRSRFLYVNVFPLVWNWILPAPNKASTSIEIRPCASRENDFKILLYLPFTLESGSGPTYEQTCIPSNDGNKWQELLPQEKSFEWLQLNSQRLRRPSNSSKSLKTMYEFERFPAPV